MIPTEASENLSLAWIGDFESLKYFVKDNLKLVGTWKQSGDDEELFTSGHVNITWTKNKHVLSFHGERAIDIMKKLCKQICEDDEVSLQTPTLDAGQSSVQSSEV